MMPKWRRLNVDVTSPRRIDVNTTSLLRHVPAGKCFSVLYRGQKYMLSSLLRSFLLNSSQAETTEVGAGSVDFDCNIILMHIKSLKHLVLYSTATIFRRYWWFMERALKYVRLYLIFSAFTYAQLIRGVNKNE